MKTRLEETEIVGGRKKWPNVAMLVILYLSVCSCLIETGWQSTRQKLLLLCELVHIQTIHIQQKISLAQYCMCMHIDTVNMCETCVSHRVTFAGLELEVVCFVKHWILLHKQLLVELLDYLKENTEGDQCGAFKFPAVKAGQYWFPMEHQ